MICGQLWVLTRARRCVRAQGGSGESHPAILTVPTRLLPFGVLVLPCNHTHLHCTHAHTHIHTHTLGLAAAECGCFSAQRSCRRERWGAVNGAATRLAVEASSGLGFGLHAGGTARITLLTAAARLEATGLAGQAQGWRGRVVPTLADAAGGSADDIAKFPSGACGALEGALAIAVEPQGTVWMHVRSGQTRAYPTKHALCVQQNPW